MDKALYAEKLGMLVANMQSLEVALRAFLSRAEDDLENKHVVVDLDNIKAGDMVQENAFTNYDTLKELIVKYNKSNRSDDYKIDDSLVKVRDALAHGRLSAKDFEMNPIRLLKFAKPTKTGKVRVELDNDLTKEWFKENINLFRDAIMKVKNTGYLS